MMHGETTAEATHIIHLQVPTLIVSHLGGLSGLDPQHFLLLEMLMQPNRGTQEILIYSGHLQSTKLSPSLNFQSTKREVSKQLNNEEGLSRWMFTKCVKQHLTGLMTIWHSIQHQRN